MYTLTFPTMHRYDESEQGITLPVALSLDNHPGVELPAKVDTGASFCIFKREYGEVLGLKIEDGFRQRVVSITGNSFEVFGHEVNVRVLGVEVFQMVYFAGDRSYRRDVLGRSGWLDRIKIAISDYERKLYLSPYEDQ